MSNSHAPPPAVRWGFAGCGRISHDFALAMSTTTLAAPSDSKLQACAARSLAAAQQFAADLGVATAHGSYAALCADPDVDVVYVGTLHTSHAELATLALTHGKHVVVEKPMAMNSAEAARVIALAEEKKLFFLEGMWTRFFPAIRKVRSLIAENAIGEVRNVQANMGFVFGPENDRVWKRSMGGGGLLDIGIYPLAFITMVFGTSPERVTAVGKLSPDEGVDVYASVTLEYGGARFGTFQYSMHCQMDENVTILGSSGRIVIQSPAHTASRILVTSYLPDGMQGESVHNFEYPAVAPAAQYVYRGSQGFLYEIEAVNKAIRNGAIETAEFPPAESLGVHRIMDEVRRQLGVVYEADS
ncbi:putative dimeric dihydrodiol dehydrogenase [Zopfochytrium polystomum]|nr:putative dimeric dihydrodiol dehydrogenase [Zopfochytrium polystomum]